jgi:hypothetical protein
VLGSGSDAAVLLLASLGACADATPSSVSATMKPSL